MGGPSTEVQSLPSLTQSTPLTLGRLGPPLVLGERAGTAGQALLDHAAACFAKDEPYPRTRKDQLES